MQVEDQIGEVVIVGGGPVGNFSAAMIGMFGMKCTVYQKRPTYTRQINLKIQKDFFKNVHEVMNKVGRCHRAFFFNLEKTINEKQGKILLNNLQQMLKKEAEDLGVKYVIGKQIKTFQQVQELHKDNKPLILDCSGRNSFLRTNQFGPDETNMKINNLHHALHINFKANVDKNFDFKFLYPVLKSSDNLKLGQVIVSKKKESQNSNYSHVTVPLFISDTLSDIIDKKYPTINRNPLKPFLINSESIQIVGQVQQVVSSLFCALLMQDWDIDWSSVVLKKINITCGFSIGRSKNKYVCLGDSAAHFAYFKSLNFGLNHAFEFVKILSGYHSLRYNLGPFDEKKIINQFKLTYPLLIPQFARPSSAPAHCFVITTFLKVMAPYAFDIRTNSCRRIDIIPYTSHEKIQKTFLNYEQDRKKAPWVKYLQKFQKIRKFDIDMEIMSNKNKKTGAQVISYFIWLNGLSPIKFSQTISYLQNGYFLDKKDFDYFGEMLHEIKLSTKNWDQFKNKVNKYIKVLMTDYKNEAPKQFMQFLTIIDKICKSEKFQTNEFCQRILSFKWSSKANKYKQMTLFYKVIFIIAKIINNQQNDKKLVKKQSQLIMLQ